MKEKTIGKRRKIFNKIFKRFGYFMLIVGVWTNGFMFGAIDRIIEATSKEEFNIHFILTFIVIFGGIIYIKFGKNKK